MPGPEKRSVLCGLSEGQGLCGHHTTPGLIVSRTASPRHPTVKLAASVGAPTGQTQQGPWAAGGLPRGQIAPIFRQAFVCASAYIYMCVCACVFVRKLPAKYIYLQTYLRIYVCLGISVFSYSAP